MRINFEKVKNYNQFMLAMAVTIGVIFLLFGTIAFIVETSSYWFRDSQNQNSGILAEEKSPETLRDTIPKQLVSFRNIELLDSAEQIFIFPITQAALVDLESYEDFYRFSGRSKFRKDRVFNNLLLYDSKNETSKVLFSSRISISHYQSLKIKNETFLFILGSSKDSNKDKFLDGDDLQELFVYDILKKKLVKIEIGRNRTILEIINPDKTDIVFGSFGLDRNKDGEFAWHREAVIFQKIDIKNGRLVEVASEKQIEDLQKLLEGR